MNTAKIGSIKSTSDSIVIYKDESGNVELRADVKEDTIWATLNQIAGIFDVQKAVVSKHLKNIYASNELNKDSTVSIMETVQIERGRKVKRDIEYHNLDAIIAVGYRVNSKKATQFRIWATGILRSYLIKGHALNRHRLIESGDTLEDLHEAITLIESKKYPGKFKGRIMVKMTKDVTG